MRPATYSIDEVLAHRGFVRALARSLVRDEHLADDLVQQTWLKVMARPPLRREGARSWLATVLRNLALQARRGASRRGTHEASVLAGESVPSTLDIVERMDAHRILVESVLQLQEPYRSTVLLRFFEGLTLPQVGVQMGVPTETARTRLRRALSTLRGSWREKNEGRGGSVSALVALAGLEGPANVAAVAAATSTNPLLLGGSLAMSTAAKLSLAGIAAVLVAGVWWWAQDDPPIVAQEGVVAAANDPVPDDPGVSPVEAQREAPAPVDPIAPAPEDQEGAAPIVAEAGLGSVVVRVSWQEDGSPAADVGLRLGPVDDPPPLLHTRRARTDAGGVFRLDKVRAGSFRAGVVGFNSNDDARRSLQEFEVIAGQETLVELEIPTGVSVKGQVVDAEDQPVKGAAIWISDTTSTFQHGQTGQDIATSDAQGRFLLPSIGHDHVIGAYAAGHAPSALHYVRAMPGHEVEVKIQLGGPGGILIGTVTGPRGAPIANALVMVGEEYQGARTAPDGGVLEGPPSMRVRSDDRGRFVAKGIPVGKVPVAARAEGYAYWSGSVVVEARRIAETSIQLGRGAALHGRVITGSGDPVEGARVRVGPRRRGARTLFASSYSTTDAGGHYAFEAVQPGAVWLDVEGGEAGKALLPVLLPDGQIVERDVELIGASISGQVVDATGQACRGWKVQAVPPDNRKRGPEVRTDETGFFEIKGCTGPQRLLVFDPVLRPGSGGSIAHISFLSFPCAETEAIASGTSGVRIEVRDATRTTAFVTGTLLESDGTEPMDAQLHVAGPGFVVGHRAGGNQPFRVGPFPPGRYRIHVTAEDRADIELGWFELAADRELDLGTIQFQVAGSLVVRASFDDGRALPARSLWAMKKGEERSSSLNITGDVARSGPLSPGDYELYTSGADIAQQRIPFVIAAGQETQLEVEVRTGYTRDLIFDGPISESVQQFEVRILDHTTDEAWSTSAYRDQEGILRCRLRLARGDYEIQATAGDLESSLRLTVDGAATEAIRVTLSRPHDR